MADNNDFNMEGGRPRYDNTNVSKFWAHDQVYLVDGRGLQGPYKILSVVRLKVYTLCTLQGQIVGNGAEYEESRLQAA
ncbi:hypothetical protein F5B19DRAFT_433405 [Rostrohypoxylon terebratum]|nr:hypothetical protein F5B19DRAFT_433405 [Rostrohypoxylon terebratum]